MKVCTYLARHLSLRTLARSASGISIRLSGRAFSIYTESRKPYPTRKQNWRSQDRLTFLSTGIGRTELSTNQAEDRLIQIWIFAFYHAPWMYAFCLVILLHVTAEISGDSDDDLRRLLTGLGFLEALLDTRSVIVAQKRAEKTLELIPKITTPTYFRLPRGNIRLLLLEPGNFADPISYRLIHDDRTNPLRYEALSYAWGSSEQDQPSLCNGVQRLILHDLGSALRHLRLRSRARLLWVDALCI
jgi:Heterokaryon incompatibility protein (HET)